jgi:two-component system response regulator PilR (NtrC family)
MKAEISALLLHSRSDPLHTLEPALQGLSVKTSQVPSCSEARRVLEGSNPPELIFTDTQLLDGSWMDVLRLAERVATPVNVIVVSRVVDVRFYIEVVEAGAFDYIAPPFEAFGLAHVVCCAAGNVLRRRSAQAQATQTGQRTLTLASPQSSS